MMKKVISFSGGRTSAYLVHLFKDDPNAHFVFMDTGAEHPATYRFIKDIVKHWNIDLVCLRVVVNPEIGKGGDYRVIGFDELKQDLKPWEDMLAKYGAPAFDMAYCTARMKTEPFNKYCNDTFGKGNYETWLGIRTDEPARLLGDEATKQLRLNGYDEDDLIDIFKDLSQQIDNGNILKASDLSDKYNIKLKVAVKTLKKLTDTRKRKIRYLAEISDLRKDDVLDWWEKQSFDLSITEHLGNCVFCIKKGPNKVALAAKDEPEQFIKWVRVTEGPNVRTEGRKHNHKRMYRQRLHASDIAKIYKDHNRDELYRALRSSKRYESGSCSESCEVISEIEEQG